MTNSYKKKKLVRYFTIFAVIVSFAWVLVPLIFMGGNYCFSVHDDMDSYAGLVQYIYENHLFFKLTNNLDIMNGLEWQYTTIGFTLYDFLNCNFGFINGQIISRIIGCFLGFFSLLHLLKYLYPNASKGETNIMLLLSAIYIVTPVSHIRIIGIASLPLFVELFLRLRNEEKFSKKCLFGILLPTLSQFDGLLIFILGFWFVFMIVDWIYKKRLNKNLLISFILLCFSTIAINYSYFWLALHAGETNRSIYVERTSSFVFNWDSFKDYLLNGQAHASAYQKWIILPLCLFLTVYFFFKKIKHNEENDFTSLFIVIFGWLISIVGAFIMSAQESGLKIGVLIIDGFQWGRVIALTRLTWPLMIVALCFLTKKHKWIEICVYLLMCIQLMYVAVVPSKYNEALYSSEKYIIDTTSYGDSSNLISCNEFFSTELFDEIKEDIQYDNEGVVAYGFHPSVLLYNNFKTIDGYFTVHSMKWQLEFREIIAPELEHNDEKRENYDTWGGRMYIYGLLSYKPTKEKYVDPTSIYINSEALKKYGGYYVFSRAMISNAEEENLTFVNDYNSEKSMYHIYLYKVN